MKENKDKVKLLHDFIAVKKISEDKITEGGIILPGTVDAKRRLVWGRVINKGDKIACDVEIGNTVLFDKNYSYPVQYDGEELEIFHESFCLMVVQE